MNLHECPRVEDAAGYVLRALPDDECESYRYHVAECEQCTEKVAELGFVANALLSGVPQLQAPPEVRERVMAVVNAEAQLLRAAGPAADRPVTEPAWRTRILGGFSLRLWPATALACALLALGIGAGTLLDRQDGAPDRVITAKVTQPGATAVVRLSAQSTRLELTGMRPPPERRIYQVWLDPVGDRGPEPTQALFSVNREGRATVAVPGDLDDVAAVLVTHEPLGGSPVPTRQPVIQARL